MYEEFLKYMCTPRDTTSSDCVSEQLNTPVSPTSDITVEANTVQPEQDCAVNGSEPMVGAGLSGQPSILASPPGINEVSKCIIKRAPVKNWLQLEETTYRPLPVRELRHRRKLKRKLK